jgi:hypothetical protein
MIAQQYIILELIHLEIKTVVSYNFYSLIAIRTWTVSDRGRRRRMC